MLNWLLIFVPVTAGLEFLMPGSHTLIFLAACLAVIPLAGWLGHATEELARHTGDGAGGLLNATFGNAAELIIALMAIRKGLYPVVKASLTGSIIGNILLVLGAAVLAGGLKHKRQRFNVVGARAQATLLTLAAIALVMPAAFHALAGRQAAMKADGLSLGISCVLLIAYGLHLLFSLRTHKQLFAGAEVAPAADVTVAWSLNGAEAVDAAGPVAVADAAKPVSLVEDSVGAAWSVKRAVLTLAGATLLIAWMSEILVGSVQQAAAAFGMTNIFIGVIVVAIVGNAAEHSSAVMLALKDRMELAMGIAVGSSLQIALFVAPLLVIVSHFIGPRPMDLMFTPAEVLAIFLAVLITGQIAADGESNWIEGVQLLAVYFIMAIVFYFLPETGGTDVTP